jgi:DNA-binding IclR family transcriptional regulator
MSEKKRAIYRIEAVDRAINILTAFTHTQPDLKLSEVVDKTGLPKATAYRMLSNLCARHMCQLDRTTGRYSLGYEVLKMADIRRQQINYRQLALPAMQELRDVSNETIVLSVRDGDDRVNVDYVESRDPLRRVPEPGRRAPLYSGAASKAFMSVMSDDEIDSYLARTQLEKRGPNTITDTDELRRTIVKNRADGYSESRGEQTPQGNAIAAPVFDNTGHAVFVISISYVDARFTKTIRKKSIVTLLRCCRELSRQLGARV